ncbi:hypothetical protein IVA94_38405 [Bradyrhizobium sp. 156]|nr:hypothetical protein [Bradyrhizobium sp. 156]MCK1326565.1 hypothetical protein [Bradyrhizobium sp. 156]
MLPSKPVSAHLISVTEDAQAFGTKADDNFSQNGRSTPRIVGDDEVRGLDERVAGSNVDVLARDHLVRAAVSRVISVGNGTEG